MLDALKNALTTADRLDVQTGFFYLSGFETLAEELRHVHIRVLVGMEIDASLIPQIARAKRDGEVDLTRFRPRSPTTSQLALRSNYVDAFVGLVNDSEMFDDEQRLSNLDLFLSKIEDGSLEIRRTLVDDHSKMYLVHNRPELSQAGDFPGTRIVGSSNWTFSGLIGQAELNVVDRNSSAFREGIALFERQWSEEHSIPIADTFSKSEFLEAVRSRAWRARSPQPFELYLRVLDEYFSHDYPPDLKTPSAITNGAYWNLEYQLDAVRMGLDRIRRYSGAIIADVAGLGKSIIAATIARNLDMNTVIVCPPHLIDEWEDYKEDFGIRGSRVFSSGAIGQVFERYSSTQEPILLILDEAHRYRNEDTIDYQLLHQLSRSHPDNKVLVLTATPFNNAPKDLFALLKLFQTPGRSTIRTVEKLGYRFRELVSRYQALRRNMSKGQSQAEIDKEAEEIANEQRLLIEPVVVRRSRLDLTRIPRYHEDLQRQGVAFSAVLGPELLEYELGDLAQLYSTTLEEISGGSSVKGFIGSRYLIANYIRDLKALEADLGGDVDFADIKVAQTNLAVFMRRLLVMRFESSKVAFKQTLQSMIRAHRIVERWWEERQEVPIMKKGILPDPAEIFDGEDDQSRATEFENEIENLKKSKGLICVPVRHMHEQFYRDLKSDIELLTRIHDRWFQGVDIGEDPKLDQLERSIRKFVSEMPERKIVVFSMFADTVDYVVEQLRERGLTRVVAYTAARAGRGLRREIKANFDASLPRKDQANDYDIVVATDALSEGINLHRAGVIINYDIPYNPTRVVQRVGRINRIDRKTFDSILILNAFPSSVGEDETRIKQISMLKIRLVNQIVGSDHRTLTSDEELKTFFRDEFARVEREIENESWDTRHRALLERYSGDAVLMERVRSIPHRSRVGRSTTEDVGLVVFGKRDDTCIFALKTPEGTSVVVTPDVAIGKFECGPNAEGRDVSTNFSQTFSDVRNKLFERDPLPPISGRREKALGILTALSTQLPASRPYCQDLIRLIKDFDDVNDGVLKEIAGSDLTDLEQLYESIKRLMPPHIISSSFQKGDRTEQSGDVILLAMELTE